MFGFSEIWAREIKYKEEKKEKKKMEEKIVDEN